MIILSKRSAGAVVLGMALTVLTPNGGATQELITHTFRCPQSVNGRTAFDSRISSDPVFSLSYNSGIQARFFQSFVAAQKVGCLYRRPGHADLVYSYMVQRQIVSCQNVGQGKPEFTCQLRP